MLGLGLGCVGAGLCWMVLGAGLSWDCVIVGVGFGWSGVKERAGVGLEWVGVGLEWVGSWAGVELDLGWVCSCLCTQAKMPQKTLHIFAMGLALCAMITVIAMAFYGSTMTGWDGCRTP